MVPILAIIPLSFNSGDVPDLSVGWPFAALVPRIHQQRAVDARARRTASSSVCRRPPWPPFSGTMAALGLTRANFRGKGLVMAILLSPMIVPVVITAVGFYFFFAPLGLTGELYRPDPGAHRARHAVCRDHSQRHLAGLRRISRARRRQPRGKPGGHILPCHFAVDCAGRLLRALVRFRPPASTKWRWC